MGLVVAILVLLAIFVLISCLVMSDTMCSKCVHDNYRNELCEHCKYYEDSLRHGYVKYCESHDKYRPREGENNVK